MADDAKRETGFYWIVGAGDDPEVARWDAESEGWSLIGGYEGASDEGISVISEVLPQPSYWRVPGGG